MLKIRYRKQFKKDYKRSLKQTGHTSNQISFVIQLLANEESLPDSYRDHSLTGNYTGFRECHIQPDWLLIYKVASDILTLTSTRTSSHSELF